MYLMADKLDDFLNAIKLGELIHRKAPEERRRNTLLIILAIVGGVAAIAAIAYAVYRYMNPDYMNDFDDEFDEYEEEEDITDELAKPQEAVISEE